MICVKEDDAARISEEKNKEYSGQTGVETATGIEFKVNKVDYTVDKTKIRGKERILGYPIKVWLTSIDGPKVLLLDKFEASFDVL